ncbi:hypothetical protein N5923_06535 [Erwiniaceae bacterium BAC15a-03b]|uniref:Uncharacterized protein n=1 Tax=Winslowiella arboricola TaxID=2978220 RepID=A0A9J6PQX4_9GAMM|nr:hypothetical protein [Winslowiella arboricola]MCU5772844.1 hypothetical protein [Winslowiella arboricola]MCU5777148.1 hypothetical protein [Winslowiella arboricola]
MENHKMNAHSGNIVTQFFAWLATLAAALGWTTQDLAYFIFGAFGVAISLASYISGRIDARAKRREDTRRTQLIENYIREAQEKPCEQRSGAIAVISDAMTKTEA